MIKWKRIKQRWIRWKIHEGISWIKSKDLKKKKTKGAKKCVIRRKLNFEDYQNCLEATHLTNKINPLEKIEIDIYSFKKGHKEFKKQ